MNHSTDRFAGCRIGWIFLTCVRFANSVIKNLRNKLIDREYLKEKAALQGAGLQEVVNSNNKSVQAAERV